jgi:hypothetical protein
MTGSTTPGHPVQAREIAELLAWTRQLSAVGPAADPAERAADPAERAAYLAAKTDLLARITAPDPDNPEEQ